jgi:hypothetical protein
MNSEPSDFRREQRGGERSYEITAAPAGRRREGGSGIDGRSPAARPHILIRPLARRRWPGLSPSLRSPIPSPSSLPWLQRERQKPQEPVIKIKLIINGKSQVNAGIRELITADVLVSDVSGHVTREGSRPSR